MPTIRANDIDIRYDIQGRGPWLILAHALATDLTLWDDNLAALTPNFRVLRFDARGHGGSSAPDMPYNFSMLTDDVLGLMDALAIEHAHFCGLSLGSMVAQHVVRKAPERIDRLILISTTSGYPPTAQTMWAERSETVRRQGVAPLVEPTLARWFTLPFRTQHPQIVARIARLVRATPPAGYIGSCQAIATLATSSWLDTLSCPTLVITGADDQGTPPAMGQHIAERIAGARFALIRSAAHLCNIEQAAWTERLLHEFLHSQTGRMS